MIGLQGNSPASSATFLEGHASCPPLIYLNAGHLCVGDDPEIAAMTNRMKKGVGGTDRRLRRAIADIGDAFLLGPL